MRGKRSTGSIKLSSNPKRGCSRRVARRGSRPLRNTKPRSAAEQAALAKAGVDSYASFLVASAGGAGPDDGRRAAQQELDRREHGPRRRAASGRRFRERGAASPGRRVESACRTPAGPRPSWVAIRRPSSGPFASSRRVVHERIRELIDLLQSAGVAAGDAIKTARELLGPDPPERAPGLGSRRGPRRGTARHERILADLEAEIGRLDQIYDAESTRSPPRDLAQVMESLLDAYRAGNLLGGRLPVVLDGAFDGLVPDARDAAVRRAESQHRCPVDRRDRRPRRHEERDRAGGTIVLWPESDERDTRQQGAPGSSEWSRRGPQVSSTRTSTRTGATTSRRARPLRRRTRSGTTRSGEPPHVGHEGVGAFWDQARALAESIELVPSDVIVCGNQAAMVFEIHVTLAARRRRRR